MEGTVGAFLPTQDEYRHQSQAMGRTTASAAIKRAGLPTKMLALFVAVAKKYFMHTWYPGRISTLLDFFRPSGSPRSYRDLSGVQGHM